MTSEAIEESGVNVFMLALVPAIGRVRGRAVGTPSGLNTWGGIRTIPTGQSINDSRLSRHYSPVVRSVQSQSSSRLAFRSGVGGKPHRLWTKNKAGGGPPPLIKSSFGRSHLKGIWRFRPRSARPPMRRPRVRNCRNPINAFLTLPAVIRKEEPNRLGRLAPPN